MEIIKNTSAGIFILLIVLVAIFYALNPVFLSAVNIQTMARSMSYSGIIAVGMALCLISGVIDLSVGSTAAFASVMFGRSLALWHMDFVVSILIALSLAVAIGLFNSFVILKMKVTPFIATISMMFVIRGLANWASNGYSIYPLPEPTLMLGYAKPLGVSWAFVAFLIIIAVAHIVMEYSLFGLLTRATGSDREVATCTEVDVDKVNGINLIAISLLAGIAGIFISFMLNAGAPTVGTGWEFTAITACAIGGVSLFGYHGNMFGLFCGLAVIQVIQNGIVMIGVSPYLQTTFIGCILLIAMAVDVRRRTYLNLDRV
jgi:ribose transport system permease protein